MTAARRAHARGASLPKAVFAFAIPIFVAFASVLLGPAGIQLGPTYDGWIVGDLDRCPEPNSEPGVNQPTPGWDCDATLALWLATAGEAFDRRDPGHAPVVRVTLHHNASSAKYLSNPLEIAVFELSDGTVRAIGVGHFGVSYDHIATRDYGP